jgi:hypothetical protein
MSIDPEKRKHLRRIRADFMRIQRSDYAKSDPEFLKEVRQFIRLIPSRNEDFVMLGFRASSPSWFQVYYDERINEYERLFEWQNRIFDEWAKRAKNPHHTPQANGVGRMKEVTEIKEKKDEGQTVMKEVTEIKEKKDEGQTVMKKVSGIIEQKSGQTAMSFRGGARPGAGRKRIGTTRTIKLTLPDELWAILDREPSASEGIRKILADYLPTSGRGSPQERRS